MNIEKRTVESIDIKMDQLRKEMAESSEKIKIAENSVAMKLFAEYAEKQTELISLMFEAQTIKFGRQLERMLQQLGVNIAGRH